ncbi:unnamed protein product [Mytilus edulis]|uniref:Uncharacterized protein n=3 Tax=Mytilus TaxID=6548 RepID=A0A8S3VKZ5_MYTED|nr:unnamed protein product [Mytilus edulis]
MNAESECTCLAFETSWTTVQLLRRMKTMNFIVAFGLLIIAIYTNVVSACPDNCYCSTTTPFAGQVNVDCDSKGLTVIPRNFNNDSYSINMHNNSITIIEEGTFQNMTLLYQLDMNSCEISTIERGAFINLPILENLYLHNNRITTIHQGTFVNLPALKVVNLFNNQVATLTRETLADIPALYVLNLYSNKITILHKGTFGDVPALYHLYLADNTITTIQQGAFEQHAVLQRLDLNDNNMIHLRKDTFVNLYSLRYLYLQNNQLVTIETGSFRYLPRLQRLWFKNNLITTLHKGMFQGLPALYQLDIVGNNFTFVKSDTFTSNPSLRFLYLELICDCINAPFWSWIKSFPNRGSVTCLDQNNVHLSSLPTSDFENCTVTLYCPIVDSSNLCAENVDNFNTKWSITAQNTIATLKCSGYYTGYVSRYCSSYGKWEEPNYSNCISKSIQNLKSQTKLLAGASDYDNVTLILEDLENITRDNNELRSGDLLTSSAILNGIAKYVTKHKDKHTSDQLEIFGTLCNNLLDDRNYQQWNELNVQGLGGITSLVHAVSEYTKAFNDVLDGEFSLVVARQNVVIQIGKTSSDEIHVPDRLKTSDSWISETQTEITLTKNTCSGLTGYSSTFYKSISGLFPKYLILDGNVKSFNGSYDDNMSMPFCGHWNFSAINTVYGAWSSFGSRLVDASDSYTICEYNHTTNFAILMSPGKTPSSHYIPLSVISAIGCGVSILFLVITILIHMVLWRYVRNERTQTLMNLCVALLLSYVIFLAGISRTENKVVCSAIAIVLHYLFLTDFALMLAQGIQIVRMVVIIFNKGSIIRKLIPACWIIPAVIVGVSAGTTGLKGYGNHQFCWLTLESNLIWAFIGPALLVSLINLIIIIITVYKILTSTGLAAKTLQTKYKTGLKSICVILPLFGVTWVLGAFSLNDDLVMFQYLFAICNSLQGLFICLFHCFLNEQVRLGYSHYQRRRHAGRMDLKLSTESTKYENPKTQQPTSTFDNICTETK